jgi:hypothetical protein
MAFSRTWDSTQPPDSQAANLLGQDIRQLKDDIKERMNSLFVVDWTTDPLVPLARRACRLFHSAAQVIPNTTNTVLAWDSESFDTATLHDIAVNNSRITIPTGGNIGTWRFSAVVAWADSNLGQRAITIRKNGVGTVIAQLSAPPSAVAGINYTQMLSTLVNAPTVGDYFEVFVFQLSGGNLNVIQGTTVTYFEAEHLI